MQQRKGFLRHGASRISTSCSPQKKRTQLNASVSSRYSIGMNLSLAGCSSAEPDSVSVHDSNFQSQKLYLQNAKFFSQVQSEVVIRLKTFVLKASITLQLIVVC